MARPVTLFTGQWADLPLEELAEKAAGWGFDGLELACWGDHFDVGQALADPGYTDTRREILDRHGLQCFAISTHLVSQCVCDPIDERHRAILSPELWGDGEPEGVRQRAAEEVANTARAAAKLGVTQVNGFTGSSVWHLLYSFPPNDWEAVERGYADFAERWSPIIDVFDQEGVRYGLEVHPTEIAYDFVTTRKALAAIDRPRGLRHQLRPEPFRPPVPRLGCVRGRVRRPDLPRPRERLPEDARRAQQHSRRRISTSASRPRLGLRLAGAW